MRLFNFPLAFSLLLLATRVASAQRRLPVLRATRPKLSIREGQALYADMWGVASAARPDVFVAQPFAGRKRVVFYSDLDSLALWVKPGQTYNFVVLVSGQDSAYTQVSTRSGQKPTLAPKLAYTRLRPSAPGPDTLRFQLDPRFGIHLQGQLNHSAPLDFLFDTGAGAVVLTTAAIASQRVQLHPDGQTLNTGADGQRVAARHRLRGRDLRWGARLGGI